MRRNSEAWLRIRVNDRVAKLTVIRNLTTWGRMLLHRDPPPTRSPRKAALMVTALHDRLARAAIFLELATRLLAARIAGR